MKNIQIFLAIAKVKFFMVGQQKRVNIQMKKTKNFSFYKINNNDRLVLI